MRILFLHGWQSVPGESTGVNLVLGPIGSRYLFTITAEDAEGSQDVPFERGRNGITLRVVATEAAARRGRPSGIERHPGTH